MVNLSFAVALSIVNMILAVVIYLSLHGWIVEHEESGMQLIVHIFLTGPVVLITSIYLYFISKHRNVSHKLWKLNLVGLLVPIMSMQTGVTYYHYDKVGLIVAVVIPIVLAILYLAEVRRMCN